MKHTTGIIAAAVLTAASLASADIITTTFVGGNGFTDGQMFNVTSNSNGLLVNALDLNMNSSGLAFTLEVYTKSGSYEGFETNAGAWTLAATGNGVSAGAGNASHVDISDYLITANVLTGIYVKTNLANGSDGITYTNGWTTYSNSDLSISEGAGVWGAFGAIETFSPRTWNGSIYYEPTASVPEPTTMALFGLGLVAMAGFARRKR